MFFIVGQFVFKLNADNVSAILIKQALYLFINLLIPNPYFFHVVLVVVAQLVGLLQEPVRECTVSAFAVRPRTDAQNHVQVCALRFHDKLANIPVACKVKLSLGFLVVYPKQVCRDDGDAACFHFAKFPVPVFACVAHKMIFAHHANPRLSCACKILACHVDGFPVWVFAAHVKVVCQKGGFLILVELVLHFCLHFFVPSIYL